MNTMLHQLKSEASHTLNETQTKEVIIIDFDSTFTKVEALDELANLVLEGKEDKLKIEASIKEITNKAMNGDLAFDEALKQRLDLLSISKNDIALLATLLKTKVSDSFLKNLNYLKANANSIYIISGGFKEFILPVVTEFGIKAEHIFANEFLFDENDRVIGYDETNFLSKPQGKVQLVRSLQFDGNISVIGDGYTDYEIKEAGLATNFFLFTENVSRPHLIEKADKVIASLDEFIYFQNMNKNQSFPKHKIKVLLLENIHANALQLFNEEGYKVETMKEALDEEELIQKIKDIHILGIRSKTQVSDKVLKHANKLLCIGTFCIGTNQIDLKSCANKGVVVFNAPYSNTRSVVELAVGEMIMLMRNIFTKSNQMHEGKWDKSAKNSVEIRGKKLGLIGYGNIGSQFSVIAEALGMRVYFYDISDKLAMGNAHKCKTLSELLKVADVISLHVDGRESNTNMIGAAEFQMMKDNVIFMNLSRGHVIDIHALKDAVHSGKVWGVSVDVYPNEPKSNDEEFVSELRNLPNTILTPHIGGSTEEAQANIGEFVSSKIQHYINKGDTYGSVNFPEVQLPTFENSHRLLHIHENVPGILAKINAVYAQNNINIQAQYLKTVDEVGYVITDISTDYNTEMLEEIKNIEHTIKFRILY